MSKYNKQNRLDEKAVSIISHFFMNKHGDKFDLQFHGIKDNTPDTDGFLRLRVPSSDNPMAGKYLNQVVFFQLKGYEKTIRDNTYYCSRKLIEFCKEINLPTILFVVGDINSEAEKRGYVEIYWYHFSNINVEILETIIKEKNQSKSSRVHIPNLIPLKLGDKEFIDRFYTHVKTLAKKNEFLDLPKEILDLTVDHKDKIVNVSSILYLVGKLENANKDCIIKMLKLNQKQLNNILTDLRCQKLIYLNKNTIIFKQVKDEFDRDVGLLLLYETISKIDLDKLLRLFPAHAQHLHIYRNLSKVRHPLITKYFKLQVANLAKLMVNFKTNEKILNHLELLEYYIQYVPNEGLGIIRSIINNKNPLKPKVSNIKGWEKIKGKSHSDLLIKSIDILEKICYLKPKKVFTFLVKLSAHQNSSIQSRTKEALKKMSEYNLFALKKIGYQSQILLLDEIEKWGDRKLINNLDTILEITHELLSPSFGGHSSKDYKTFVIHSGTLGVDDNLKKIRNRTLVLLQNLYSLSKEIKQRKQIIQVFQEATQPPPRGNYGDETESMLLDNANTLINYYISIIPNADSEIIKDIEEQVNWFVRRFSKEKLSKIKELQHLIASNKDYEMFRAFVGYDYKFTEDRDWRKAEEIRKNKIQEFINEISENNYKEWEKKILSVIKNYSSLEDTGEFQYFNIFLHELAKQKPKIAYDLLGQNERVLEPFLIHLVTGIWKSKSKKLAKDLISVWTDKGKHLSVCAYIFDYINELDKLLLDKIFKKSKVKKDIGALNNIISSIVRNYPKNKDTKVLFIKTIQELTKNNNWRWVNNVWYRGGSILKSFSETNFDTILENLLLNPRVDYHVEEVLMPIAEKYPVKVIYFFQKRVSVQIEKKRKNHYDAIPFTLHKIKDPLSKNVKIVVPEILKWFAQKDWLFSWEASHLLHAIFPIFHKSLKKELLKLIGSKNNKRIKITFSILRAYKGQEFLHNVCRELIKEYSKNKKIKDKYDKEMFIVLSQMGVVSGEYGFVEGYRKKKEAIQNWKKDTSPIIKSFIKKYANYLDKQILYEQKRADESIELMKREFGS